MILNKNKKINTPFQFGIFINMNKLCLNCKLELPLKSFGKNKRSKDGYFYRCIECEKKRKKKFYEDGYNLVMATKQDSRKPYTKLYFENMDIFRVRHRTAKQRARKRGLEFSITIEYIVNLFEEQKGLCYITGMVLSLDKYKHNTISIDRIDSSKGYIEGNIGLCTDFINGAKSDYTMKELLDILSQIKLIARA